ncbi:Na/Pi cotransporter family protein [Treponema sp.]|uniref:Na/Pi cotransporter family protein n=1 Tax=Treponema sp. TaxID=166 RepID=UPI00388DCA4A
MITNILMTIFNIAGSLCLLLFGMKLMSDGIQKSAGEKLQAALGFMTKNRFLGLLTGCLLTMLIQSSGATTVMVVSFVNAGLITLSQSVAVIFGANIGTTVTAWIVALFGFDFKISALAIPIFAVGYILSIVRKRRHENIGLALMGFSLLFIALGWLSDAVSLSASGMGFLTSVQKIKFWSYPIAVLIGIAITALIHSSSAMTAIVITMAYNGVLTWEFSAALVIGSNIGSTVDSVMAAFGSKTNARRASLIHVLFNCATALLALIFLPYLTRLVDFITPGKAEATITYHIAMLHTLFNVFGTLIFLPFTNQLAHLTEILIKEKKEEIPENYSLPFPELAAHESATIPLMEVRLEIQHMADRTVEMFDRVQIGFTNAKKFCEKHYENLIKEEALLDRMQEELTAYLLRCQNLSLSDIQMKSINSMLGIVTELEELSDQCLTMGVFISRIEEKKVVLKESDKEKLLPYIELVRQLLYFVYRHIGQKLSAEQHEFAHTLENQIDEERINLKKLARTRLETGANVKAELLYIDIVRKIEKMGDSCFAIAGRLTE